jgi:biopolymer transport protein ExbD
MAGGGGENELNLVPYMDIMLNLIMFMIMATQTIGALQQVPVMAPEKAGGGGESAADEAPKATLVAVVDNGTVKAYLSSAPDQPISFPLEKRSEIGEALRLWASDSKVDRRCDFVATSGTPMSQVIAFMDIAQDPSFTPKGGGEVCAGQTEPKDDDGDGLVDREDPDCQGPFQNVVFNTTD